MVFDANLFDIYDIVDFISNHWILLHIYLKCSVLNYLLCADILI